MSCQTPMLWALAATGLRYWVVSFQASTRISIMLFKRARRGAKGKDATNNVTKPNWITVEKRRKIHKLIIVERKMGTRLLNSCHILHFGGSTMAKHSILFPPVHSLLFVGSILTSLLDRMEKRNWACIAQFYPWCFFWVWLSEESIYSGLIRHSFYSA